MPLNDRQIRNAKPDSKPYKMFDNDRGLYLHVTVTGCKVWRMDYQINGKRNTLTIGKYPAVSLVEARQAADDARRLIAQGQDPNAIKKQAKAEKRAALRNTFETLAREWHAKQQARLDSNHAARVLKSLEADVFPHIGACPIEELTALMIVQTVEAVAARGVVETAGRILQRIKSVCSYCVRTGRLSGNPAADIAAADIAVKPKVKHQPALPQSELVEFYRRVLVEPLRPETRIALLFIVLTFVRAGNIRYAQWRDFDLEARQWRIPAEQMKMRAPHIIPLADWTLELLDELRGITGGSRYLFPSYRDHDKPHSENMLSYAMGRMGYSGIATPHGFRSFATDLLNEKGFAPDVIERQLAHAERNKVRAAYHRTEYLPQRVQMMQWYADFLRQRYEQARQIVQNGV